MHSFNTQKFTDRVNELLEEWHAPGVAIAIIQEGTTHSRGYGKASLDPEKPVTADTLFDIASSSKSLTAASVALLVADDERYPNIKWDAKMSDLLPDDFVMSSDQYTRDITVEDILSHRTGLPGHDFSYLGIKAEHPDDARSVTRNLRNLPITAPIRTKYMYCNLMFTVATHLLEVQAGKTFSEFLQEHFFAPLRMSSTHLQPSAAIAAGLEDRISKAYYWKEEDHTYKTIGLQETPEDQGAGSIFTSVNDYIKWVKALLYQEDPVAPEVYKGLTTPRTIQDPDPDPAKEPPSQSPILYCAGFETFHYRGHKVIAHDGLVDGFASTHFFLPHLKFGGVLLGNSSSSSSVIDIITRELIDDLIDTPAEERPDWNAFHHKLEQSSEDEDKNDESRNDSEEQPLQRPLSTYTGTYQNAGYHILTVEARADELFVDARDRSFQSTITFKHRSDGTKFTACLRDCLEEDEVEELNAEFQFEEEKVVRLGIKFEDELDDMIWFDKL